jgi:hypothetical protein
MVSLEKIASKVSERVHQAHVSSADRQMERRSSLAVTVRSGSYRFAVVKAPKPAPRSATCREVVLVDPFGLHKQIGLRD